MVLLTSFGPPRGPILADNCPDAIGVLKPGSAETIGAAFRAGRLPRRGGAAVVFRIQAEGVDPDSRWIVQGRTFVELGEAAEWES